MHRVDTLIVGAGVTGLATAAALGRDADLLVVEAEDEIGGYCRTVKQAGFTWDYSGHFFHFKHPAIEAWLRARMPAQRIDTVHKRSHIYTRGHRVDFPFQRNIHQLPRAEFLECLHDLYFAQHPPPGAEGASAAHTRAPSSFRELLERRLGRGICDRFLVPYNEKLYACDLATLDPDAMGRFFPHVTLAEVMRHFVAPSEQGYNATFTYPEGGAIEYVKALASELRPERLALGERLVSIDLERRVARTTRRELAYGRLVSTAPLPHLLAAAGDPIGRDAAAPGGLAAPGAALWSANQVMVFNLGFDAKGPDDAHWIYYPDRDVCFYRVGFYDVIRGTDRMSLYVELGQPAGTAVEAAAWLPRVLADLERVGVVSGQRLVAWHSVTMNPAYVHITRASLAATAAARERLGRHGVFPVGRYGGWTYCSIEDNVVEAVALVEGWGAARGTLPGAG